MSRLQKKSLKKPLILAAMILCSGIFHIWLRTRVVTTGYEISNLKQQLSNIESQMAQAKLKKSHQLSSKNLQIEVLKSAENGKVFQEAQSDQLYYLREPL